MAWWDLRPLLCFNNFRAVFQSQGILSEGLDSSLVRKDWFAHLYQPLIEYQKIQNQQDPVCGSAHCALASYWSKKLGKYDFLAYQASPRSGVLNLHLDAENGRVYLRGKAVAVTEGSILV